MRERDADDTAALVALMRLQAAYGDVVTQRDWDAMCTLFEPDAVVELDLRTGAPRLMDGPRALAGIIEQSLQQFVFFEFAVLNAVVDVAGDIGTGRMHISELRHHPDGSWSQIYGLYQDRYRRTDGVWRIAHRRYSSLARVGVRVESFALPPIAD